MSDQRLSEFAKNGDISYISAWRAHKEGKLVGSYKDTNGHIFVKTETQVLQPQASTANLSQNRMPDIQIENISLASDTRYNKATDAPRINRFANIDQGVIPFYDNNTKGGLGASSDITVKDAIVIINKCYHNFSIMKNIIELLTEFSSGDIFYKGGNKKSRDFFMSFFKKINLSSFMTGFFREYYRSGNVFVYIFKKSLQPSDALKITKIYGEHSISQAKKITIPSRFMILNPMDISVQEAASFFNPIYYKTLNNYEIQRLRNPVNETDKEILESLPSEVKKKIQNKRETSINLELSTEDVMAVFNAKQDYESLSLPPFFSVCDDIEFKILMRKSDEALMKSIQQAVLLVTTGFEGKDGTVNINPNNIRLLQEIFSNSSVGRVLIHDFSTKAQFIQPDLSFLDSKKYESINNDIYTGLNYILLGDEKFANQFGKIQIFIERIKHSRQIFINEFLYPIIKKISEELNFKSYPEPYFEEMDLRNEVEWARIYTRLGELGFVTPGETFSLMETGRFPLEEESLENQKLFKEQKAEGLYQAIQQNPKGQIDVLKETQKGAQKIQDKQLEHDDKQQSKQRAHDAKNPKPVAPSIHINAPTKSMPAPNGRPSGSKRKKSTNKPRVLGSLEDENEQVLYSGAKLIEVIKSYDSLEKSVIAALLKKHNIEKLSDQQNSIASEISKVIARNEEVENWKNNEILLSYIEKPLDKNEERILEIEDISASFGLDPHLGALLYASKKEETEKLEDNQESV